MLGLLSVVGHRLPQECEPDRILYSRYTFPTLRDIWNAKCQVIQDGRFTIEAAIITELPSNKGLCRRKVWYPRIIVSMLSRMNFYW